MKKILVVCLDNLGDAVMASSVIDPLLAEVPALQIGFWVKKYAAGLLEADPRIHRIHACDPFWDKAPGQPKGNSALFWQTWRQVRAEKYEAALILNADWRRALSCWLAGIPVRVGVARKKSSFFLTSSISPLSADTSMVEQHKDVIAMLYPKLAVSGKNIPALSVSLADQARAQDFIKTLSWGDRPFVVIHPFSGDVKKNWPALYWKQFLLEAAQQFPHLRWLVIASASESTQLFEKFSELKSTVCEISVIPDLGFLKALLSQAVLFVGGDSGPGHVAAAVGTKVVSLFGPSNPYQYAPTGKNSVKIIKRDVMNQISVADVRATVSEILA